MKYDQNVIYVHYQASVLILFRYTEYTMLSSFVDPPTLLLTYHSTKCQFHLFHWKSRLFPNDEDQEAKTVIILCLLTYSLRDGYQCSK
jgi:hypothetical protein